MKIKDAPLGKHPAKVGRVAIVVDQSGSMSAQRDDTIGTLNAYIAGLKASPILVSLYTFDGDSGLKRLLHEVPSKEAPKITRDDYTPHGATPLYEAVIAVISENNEPHVVVIITDGQDTSGQSSLGVSSLIHVRQQQGWEFLFLGAGLDRWNAENISANLGLKANRTMNYNRHQQGQAMNLAAGATAAYAASGFTASGSFDLTNEQQDLTKVQPPEAVVPLKGGVITNGNAIGLKSGIIDPADGTTMVIREVSEGQIKKQTVKP